MARRSARRSFTDAKGAALRLEHELRHGQAAAFRFVGTDAVG